ncbi:MAG: ABC transporter permease [Chitinophagales bacterium]|nr:ABC transporter permease [Chitinophagales bacterium]
MLSSGLLIKESLRLSVQQLLSNKLRSGLSLLGVTIGIFSIITILTSIDALKKDIKGSIDKMGNQVVFVSKWPWTFGDSDYPWWEYFKRSQATYSDYKKLKTRLSKAESISYSVEIDDASPEFKGNVIDNAKVEGTTQEFVDVFDLDIEKGRFFSTMESLSGNAVAVIGGGLAEELNKSSNHILGEDIVVWGRKVKIIGIVKKEGQGGLLGMNNDQKIYVPFSYANNVSFLSPDNDNQAIQVRAKQGVSLDDLMFDIQQHMRSVRKLRPKEADDFSLNQLSIVANGFNGIFSVLNIIGWVIGFFALIVGGFGIANIMYVSVTERTNIIGVKKALGAKRSYILMEFLIESIILCLMGGLIGLIFVGILTYPISSMSGMSFELSVKNAAIGLSISILIGLISGYLPAKKAALLDAVEAIRSK